MLIDLQFHSTYSDGYLTPTEVVKFAASNGIKVASLTDHNTVGGLDEFGRACRKYKIKFIKGVELYVKVGTRRINIVWYNFDDKHPELHQILRETQERRRKKIRSILKTLKEKGFIISINKLLDKYNHYVPINRIVDEIYSQKNNKQKINRELGTKTPYEEEIIKTYFRNKEVGILNDSCVSLKRILKIRKKIGGQLIYNHPAKHLYVTREFLKELKKQGIDGIDVLSPHHSIGAVMFLQSMAMELGFIITGSSDFHRHEKRGKFLIKNSWDYFKIDSKYLKGVEKIIGA